MAEADPAFTGALVGFLAADGVTATYSRTAGETVAGGPYTISATLSPAGVLGNYRHHLQHGELHHRQGEDCVGDAGCGEQDLWRCRPGVYGTLVGFLAADGVTATYSRTAGETVAGGPYTISATLSPAGCAEQLHHHLQHGQLHDQWKRPGYHGEQSDEDVWGHGDLCGHRIHHRRRAID